MNIFFAIYLHFFDFAYIYIRNDNDISNSINVRCGETIKPIKLASSTETDPIRYFGY